MLYYKKSHEPSDSWAFLAACRILARVPAERACVSHRFSGNRYASCTLWSPCSWPALWSLCSAAARSPPAPHEVGLPRRPLPPIPRLGLVFGDGLPRQHQELRSGDLERPPKRAHDLDVLRPALSGVPGLVRRTIRAHRAQPLKFRRWLHQSLRGRALPGLPHDAAAGL